MKKLACVFVLCTATVATAADGYHVIKKIHIGGPTGWDYATMDSSARRLYISNGTRVVVLDVDSGNIAGEIPDTQGVHGIAVAPELNRGFTSNGRTNNATIFDLKTLKTIGHVKTGQNPDAILFEPVSGHVMTFNGRSKDATVFDAKSGEIVATLPLGGKPEFAVDDGKGKVFVNIEDTNEMVQIDAKTSKVVSRYSLSPCDEPSGLAMDVTHRRLFSVCGNKMMVVSNPDSGKVVATPAIGEGPDAAAFDPDSGIAFSSNGTGSLTLVKEQGGKYEPIATVATEPSARTMAFDSKTHNIYLPSADMGPAPAATAQQPRPRPAAAKDSFHIVVVGK